MFILSFFFFNIKCIVPKYRGSYFFHFLCKISYCSTTRSLLNHFLLIILFSFYTIISLIFPLILLVFFLFHLGLWFLELFWPCLYYHLPFRVTSFGLFINFNQLYNSSFLFLVLFLAFSNEIIYSSKSFVKTSFEKISSHNSTENDNFKKVPGPKLTRQKRTLSQIFISSKYFWSATNEFYFPINICYCLIICNCIYCKWIIL